MLHQGYHICSKHPSKNNRVLNTSVQAWYKPAGQTHISDQRQRLAQVPDFAKLRSITLDLSISSLSRDKPNVTGLHIKSPSAQHFKNHLHAQAARFAAGDISVAQLHFLLLQAPPCPFSTTV